MRLLDLYCGAGGSAVGYYRAGFTDIVGVDINKQPRYPFEFVQGDALEYMSLHGDEFDAIHASPPCQGYSRLRFLPWLRGKNYPLLIDDTRNLLINSKKPYVIENVESSPLNGIVLCGLSFGLPIYRHRKFETSFFVIAPSHIKHDEIIGHGRLINERRKGSLNNSSAVGAYGKQKIITVAGNQFRKSEGVRAMGIDWMIKPELAQAVPPAYTQYIGRFMMASLGKSCQI